MHRGGLGHRDGVVAVAGQAPAQQLRTEAGRRRADLSASAGSAVGTPSSLLINCPNAPATGSTLIPRPISAITTLSPCRAAPAAPGMVHAAASATATARSLRV